MKFKITRAKTRYAYDEDNDEGKELPPCDGAIRTGDNWVIDISTLNGLLTLSRMEGYSLIVCGSEKTIKIYDTWVE